jgi:hypothetical protein
VEGENDPGQAVTWTVAGGVPGTAVNGAGLLTVAANESAASLTVRAASTVDTSKSGTAVVTVITPEGTGTFILVYPEDAASGELSGSIEVNPENSPVTLTVSGTFDTYQWRVDGIVKGTTETIELYAGAYSPGRRQLSLEVTRNGIPYSKSGVFTVSNGE